MNLKLVIANKNYSSWSMRPWLLRRQAGIPFEEIQLEFEQDNRVVTYPVSLPDSARAYVDAVCDLTAVTEWISAARRETGFVAADEPYAAEKRDESSVTPP